ncbi:hypothetical protein O181_037222 [Austropuccinia psidii MF-1]|uniref:Uncharacterized protein n=1 Tax=Austropuccinia psidii MF-1 TaxID=1389203 RepID=A0A9Q3DC91_9BASI|nr:hypothetical protein [Austropuccinia psidii MF-1]
MSGKGGRPRGIHAGMRRMCELEKSGVGVLGKDGLLYNGEAELITAAAAPDKVSTSRHVRKMKAQSQLMLQLRREIPMRGRATKGFWLSISIDLIVRLSQIPFVALNSHSIA